MPIGSNVGNKVVIDDKMQLKGVTMATPRPPAPVKLISQWRIKMTKRPCLNTGPSRNIEVGAKKQQRYSKRNH